MDLPVKVLTDDSDVVSNDIVFFQEDGKYKYYQVKSVFGGTPAINSKAYPECAIWALISLLKDKGIKLYKLLREEVKSNHVCGLRGFAYGVCPGCCEEHVGHESKT